VGKARVGVVGAVMAGRAGLAAGACGASAAAGLAMTWLDQAAHGATTGAPSAYSMTVIRQ
jgi:hypothetical protein